MTILQSNKMKSIRGSEGGKEYEREKERERYRMKDREKEKEKQ